MATINFLHWNIEQLSNNKINNGNGPHLVNYIAAVAAHLNANMISIIELKFSAIGNLTGKLVTALRAANGNLNAWHAVSSARNNNNEAYYVLWEAGNSFTGLASAAVGGPNPNQGYAVANQNPPPNALRFPSTFSTGGGRRPYLATFRTTDTNHSFSVLVYHAMFGGFTPRGVQNMGRLRSIQQVDDGTGNLVNMDAAIVAGDFNVDLIQYPGDYNNLTNNVGPPAADPTAYADAREAATSLVNSTPPVPWNNPLDYRVNAYDNVFGRNAAQANQGVIPLLVDSSILATGAGPYVPAITNFTVPPIRNNALLNNAPPPQDLEDAWHVVRDQISNHLPVFVSLTI